MQENLTVPFCRCEPQESEAKVASLSGLPPSGPLGARLAVQFGNY